MNFSATKRPFQIHDPQSIKQINFQTFQEFCKNTIYAFLNETKKQKRILDKNSLQKTSETTLFLSLTHAGAPTQKKCVTKAQQTKLRGISTIPNYPKIPEKGH